ncbi:MAG: hypothetical protein ACYCWE_02565 [Eubacteriales bacterium]
MLRSIPYDPPQSITNTRYRIIANQCQTPLEMSCRRLMIGPRSSP